MPQAGQAGASRLRLANGCFNQEAALQLQLNKPPDHADCADMETSSPTQIIRAHPRNPRSKNPGETHHWQSRVVFNCLAGICFFETP